MQDFSGPEKSKDELHDFSGPVVTLLSTTKWNSNTNSNFYHPQIKRRP